MPFWHTRIQFLVYSIYSLHNIGYRTHILSTFVHTPPRLVAFCKSGFGLLSIDHKIFHSIPNKFSVCPMNLISYPANSFQSDSKRHTSEQFSVRIDKFASCNNKTDGCRKCPNFVIFICYLFENVHRFTKF